MTYRNVYNHKKYKKHFFMRLLFQTRDKKPMK